MDSRRAQRRIEECLKTIERYEAQILINDFKTDWDKQWAEKMIKTSEEAIIAVLKNIYK